MTVQNLVNKTKEAFIPLSFLGGAVKGVAESKVGTKFGEQIADLFTEGAGKYFHESAYAKLPKESPLAGIYEQNKSLKSLGIEPNAYKNITGAMKDLSSISKEELEMRKLNNDLTKQNTLMGRLGRSSIGQLVTPLIGGGLLTAGGMAATGIANTVNSIDIPNPATAMLINQNLPKVLQLRPELRSVPTELLKKYYALLYRMAPTVTRDVVTAANLLSRMTNTQGSNDVLLKSLTDAERSASDPMREMVSRISNSQKLFI